MSRPSLSALKYLLSIVLLTGCLPSALAASPPTLFTMASGKAEVLAQGAQKSFPIQISENSAFDAVFQGGMWLPNPAGGRIYAKYKSHTLHSNGTWTWVGTVETAHGAQPVVLTFGKDSVFGLVPQASGYPLRIVTRQGQTRVVETSAAAMARSAQALRLHNKADYVIPPARSRAGIGGLHASVSAAADVPVRAAASGPVTIDVMVAYTPGFVSEIGSQASALTRIQNLIDITNQAYDASGVNQQIRLVYAVQVNYPDNTSNQSALDDITGIDENGGTVPVPASLQNIASLRAQYGADLVALIRGYDNATQGNCGVGWLIGGNQESIVPNQSNAYGFSVTSDGSSGGYYCLPTTFAHELGHNMGSAHDRANASESGAYSYSYGYVGSSSSGGFSTIMAYGTASDSPLSVFSNPDISTCKNMPCGVADSNSSSSADNARSLNNTAPLIAAFEPTKVGTPPKIGGAARDDINGDGKSDLLWMNNGTHQFGYWAMNGSVVSKLWSISVASGYSVVATGDFNGDGFVDVVWEGADSNTLYLWSSNGTSFTSQLIGYLPFISSEEQVVGAGDVDGDGKSDLIFTDPSPGTLEYWIMDGAKVVKQWSTSVAQGYYIDAMGDFNGDGRVDLVWTSPKRDLYLWASNGTSFDASYIGTYPAGWSLVGAGDVDGDGMSDLLWRNQSAGSFGYWIMQGSRPVRIWSTNAGSAYRVASIGDFNGDGKVDVVWTSNARDLYMWMSNGSTFRATYFGTYPGGWSMVPSQLMAWGHP